MLRLRSPEVEEHCVGLARMWADESARIGLRPVTPRQDSHIVVMEAGPSAPLLGRRLAAAKVKSTSIGDRLRVGVHYFNDVEDVERGLAVLAAAQTAQ
jgi:selenocysteine lyase/cysteine desulfurase